MARFATVTSIGSCLEACCWKGQSVFDAEPDGAPAILVIEDDVEIQIVLRRVLISSVRGYEIITVSSGAAALEHLSRRVVPLVFTDYNLPAMNGMQIARLIRRESPSTRIVLVTAYATPQLERLAMRSDSDIDYFVAKPFSIEQIEEIVRAALR
jgi:CheY-like chemotaxis protein